MVLIGLVVLAGIVVNNGIVLIDAANQLRAQGRAKVDALVEAGVLRLRPILMTALTTVLGLLPMSLGIGEGAEVRAPLAITLIGGMISSTILTLVVLPVVYATMDRRA
jgi:HAE1 family hydrophobic/amphiphilic exporter-1